MSAAALIKARLSYLDDAAKKIHHAAPTIASGLEADCDRLAQDGSHGKSKALQIRRREVCLACGHLFDSEQDKAGRNKHGNETDAPLPKSARRRLRARKLERFSNSIKSAVEEDSLTCPRCHRTTFLMPRTPSAAAHSQASRSESDGKKSHIQNSEASSVTASGPIKMVSNTNRTSKQRAKARKQGGLQAILAQSRPSQTSGSSFDLMDFMSKD